MKKGSADNIALVILPKQYMYFAGGSYQGISLYPIWDS